MRKISLNPTIPTEPKVLSGSTTPTPTAPTTATAAPIPGNVLAAWDKAAPVLGAPQPVPGNRPAVAEPGSQSTANPAALTTPNELGVHAATLPQRNQDFYMEQLNKVRGLVGGASSGWTSVAGSEGLIHQAIDILQSLAANLPPDQQKAVNQIISQLQTACSLEGTPLGNPDAFLAAARKALDDLVGYSPQFFDPNSLPQGFH